MTLINSIKNSFGCIIENPSITLFLVLFLIALRILALYVSTVRINIVALICLFTLFALIFVYLPGWFKVIKESIQREKIKEKNFYSIFLEGIGANIIPISIGLIIYTALALIFIMLAQVVATIIFGDINFLIEGLNNMPIQNNNYMEYFNNLDNNQKYIVSGWNLCIMAAIIIFNFITLFYFPSILDIEKNVFIKPFVALWNALKFLFKNFLGALGMITFIYALNMIIAILNAKFANNMILSVILLLVYIYFISYIVMLIFNYYEEKNNSSDRPDSIREDQTGNIPCEGN